MLTIKQQGLNNDFTFSNIPWKYLFLFCFKDLTIFCYLKEKMMKSDLPSALEIF